MSAHTASHFWLVPIEDSSMYHSTTDTQQAGILSRKWIVIMIYYDEIWR